MNKQYFTVEIHAPKQQVWEIMLADKTYREWTGAFHKGSYYEGSWDKGSVMRFLGPGDDGGVNGMLSKIVENRPYDYISIEHLGEVIGGMEDTSSERAKKWVGAHENYSFEEVNGITKLTVELDSNEDDKEMSGMFGEMWPHALGKLKEIVEEQLKIDTES